MNKKYKYTILIFSISLWSQCVFAQSAVFSDSTTWVLSKFGTTKMKQSSGQKIFITIVKSENKFTGYTSCNFLNGNVTVADSTILFQNITIGKRACNDFFVKFEKMYVENFNKVTAWKTVKSTLVLYNKEGSLMEFKLMNSK